MPLRFRPAGLTPARIRAWTMLTALVTSCASAEPPAARPGGRAPEEGLATYYSSRLAGRRTASGERYRPEAMTAAHRTLPFGTMVRVTRVDRRGTAVSGPVVVRINDRGPFGRGRIIDVSLAAARKLGMLRAGVVTVRLEVLPARR